MLDVTLSNEQESIYIAPPCADEELHSWNEHPSTVRECDGTEKNIAPPLLSDSRLSNVHELNEAVDERVPTCLFGVKVHPSYGGVVHSEVGLEEMCNEDIDIACFLTQSLKEEFEER